MLSPLATEISLGLSAAAGLGLAAGGCAYAAMWPASQLFGPTLIAPPRPGELALTFDDGPNPVWTPRLLDLLASHDVRATFFLVGSRAQALPALVHQIVAAGHLIGNHSWSHPNLALSSACRIDEELSRTNQILAQIAGAPLHHFRPPYGARRPEVLRAARRLGMIPVLWNAMTSDWKNLSADAIASASSQNRPSLPPGPGRQHRPPRRQPLGSLRQPRPLPRRRRPAHRPLPAHPSVREIGRMELVDPPLLGPRVFILCKEELTVRDALGARVPLPVGRNAIL